MDIVEFIIVGFGITNAVAYLSIFEWFRKIVSGLGDREFYSAIQEDWLLLSFRNKWLGKLVRCHACAGFWVGVFLSYIYYTDIIWYEHWYTSIEGHVLAGFMLSASNFFLWLIARRLGAEEL